MSLEDRFADVQVALQPLDGARQHELRFDVELLHQLALPLFGQRRRAEHRHTAYLATVEQLAGDETGFDRLADSYVVGDQQAHRVELQGHQQGHELVGPGLDGDAPEAAKRPGGGAGREARRIAQQAACGEVAQVCAAGQPERGRLDRFQRRQDTGNLLVEPAHRAEHQQFVRGVGQHHPFAAARANQGAGLGQGA